MYRSELMQRARHALTHSVALYKLGSGGWNPETDLPESRAGYCDCSGFVSWVIGEPRKTANDFLRSVNGGWIETTGIVKDARSPDGMFTMVEVPKVGDLFVWGDSGGKQGHVGIISEVKDNKATKVIHCSSGNSRSHGKAILETSAALFHRRGGIYVKFDMVKEELRLSDGCTFR